jgi:branched-chain amino acid transport system permease protein
MFIMITGLLLGGTYALIAMGLNLQYGVARIMNLANGEMLVAGGFAAFWVYTAGQVSPIAALIVVAPVAFAVNWLIYRIMLRPLVKRAKSRGALEVDSILATFGLSFALVGIMTWAFGGGYFNYSYLATRVDIFGAAMRKTGCCIFHCHTNCGGALAVADLQPSRAAPACCGRQP